MPKINNKTEINATKRDRCVEDLDSVLNNNQEFYRKSKEFIHKVKEGRHSKILE